MLDICSVGLSQVSLREALTQALVLCNLTFQFEVEEGRARDGSQPAI